MASKGYFSCYLIGGDTLLAQCAEILLQEGHDVRGIITDAERIADWAGEHDIPVIPADGDYASMLAGAEYDFLFAITHLRLIPDKAARSPRRLAINFHDGPLPAYAGLNTPLWAIINGESDYGITWHVISAGIDEGDVLLRYPVPITDDDTGLSLNTKCFAAAIESFPVLVRQLVSNSLAPEPQQLDERQYFSASRKPPSAGVLSWQQPAEALARLVRALNVGRYPNPLASAKILLGNEAYIVDVATARPQSSYARVGEITELSRDRISVRTIEGDLAITSLRALDGGDRDIGEIAARAELSIGDMLPKLSDEDSVELERIVSAAAREESIIAEELAGIEPFALPYERPAGSTYRGRRKTNVPVPAAFLSRFGGEDATARLYAAFALFLARMLDRNRLHLAVEAPASGRLHPVLADHRYVEIDFAAEHAAADQLGYIARSIEAARSAEPYLRDLIARRPELRDKPNLATASPVPVLLARSPTPHDADANASLILRVGYDRAVSLDYSTASYDDESIGRLVEHFVAVLDQLARRDDVTPAGLDLLTEREKSLVLDQWNATGVEYDPDLLIHTAFEQQAARTPNATAVVIGYDSITYKELDARANSVAGRLRELGIGPDVLVGVHLARSIELMVATLGVLKAGGAYVPLDPAFPPDRLEFMIADSKMPLIISQAGLRHSLPVRDTRIIDIQGILDFDTTAGESMSATGSGNGLAYVIYTSGSTGKPKGVMIEHRNVSNFFAAMDRSVPQDQDRPGTWLAVTSLSFDISVLELFWTLTRGFKVVIYSQELANAPPPPRNGGTSGSLGLGLFMWGNDDAVGQAKYRLLIEGAKYFDVNGFVAVWTPERHFHAFGGPYPNPAVTGAAIAAVTKNVKIRAGSCVVPLHHPIRIAEEWAVVDNLSNGRVEIAAASGWNPNDFVLRPENHANNKEIMFTNLEQVRRLWRGEKLAFPGPLGAAVEVQSLPRPIQAELPCWVTTAGNPDTWRDAGRRGLNVLTHLLGQTVDEVGQKIALYREALAEAGFDPAAGRVALMLHTFVGEDNDSVRELVREPMKAYLSSSMRLAMNFAWSFPAFKRPGGADTKPEDIDIKCLTEEEIDTILDFAFDRYFSTSGLFGDLDTCLAMLKSCSVIGVDEIACLLDFGVETDVVMDSLPRLKQVNDALQATMPPASRRMPALESTDFSFSGLVREHDVTHLQCTPSMARMLATDDESRLALGKIPHLLLGGEALPTALASELLDIRSGTLINLYGPTETTIWSLTHSVSAADTVIPIGRPIANTRIYILDERKHPVPVGVPGQLYIGGDGVARGYLNRPELTAERFVPDPFRAWEGARMYATGDLARYRPDGIVDFLGRSDFQVKVRGFRIELGEIEAVLEEQVAIVEAAVVVRSEDAADQRLVAYVVPENGAAFDAAAIRSVLGAKLPDYMVPNEIIGIDSMPRTANGKLDRKALIEIRRKVVLEAPPTLPASDTETTITQLWKETLKLDSISVDANFFDLGGHSLLIVQLHSKLKQAIDVPISLTDLYQYPTVRSLSDYLTSGGSQALQRSVSRGARRRALRTRSVS